MRIPPSKLALTILLFIITVVDVFVAVSDLINQNYGMGIALLIMGAIICGRGVFDLVRGLKNNRR